MKTRERASRLSAHPRTKVRLIHALSGRLALELTVGTVVLLVLGLIVAPLPWWIIPVVSVAVGAMTYVLVQRRIARRMELARSTLRQIRKHKFENLELAHAPEGDELNDLIWQVYRTGQVLEREFQELNKMENYRREFVGNVSHELKTPIFAIRGFAETLLDGALDDAEVNRAFVEKIVRNADRLSNLARDLSEISNLETGEQPIDPQPFDLNRLVKDVVDSLEPFAARKSITLTVSLARSLPAVHGDPARIRQVLVNLIDNAIKYSNDGGYVEVGARDALDESVKISVSDNGIGISEEDIPRLTERFFRVDKSRSRTAGGTGLGLSIVKHILAAHDQVLQVESRSAGGSTFGFHLPVAIDIE